LEDLDPATALPLLQDVVRGAPEPMARAVEAVRIDNHELVVSFRQPAPLPTKDVEGRLVECLLY